VGGVVEPSLYNDSGQFEKTRGLVGAAVFWIGGEDEDGPCGRLVEGRKRARAHRITRDGERWRECGT
jgi:hypothetical protein